MGDYRYRAFISYSHADEQAGARFQRSLERFRAPKELAQRLTDAGKPLGLAPVFRDREDLPVAGNLNDAIQQALADSEFQIVLCSPNAAKSRWVNEEIKLFHRLHGPGRTFAVILAGEPNAGGEAECFPQALRFALDADGEPTAAPAEPLAADAREGGDGKRYALLKTAAGMLGVNLDDLVRRDAQRRARAARNWLAASASITASMAFAAAYSINQRNEAQVMRAKAETLVEFMLSDLSDRLEPVGKLDILEAVGGEVLDYYADQDLKALDASALSRRAQALMKLGQVDERRGDLDAALKAYEAAFASTEEQLRRAPDDPNRIFDHAQSVFYVGNVAVERGDFGQGQQAFSEYQSLAQRLISHDPTNPKWRLEVAYAKSNLGALKYKRGDYSAALPFFEESATIRQSLSDAAPKDRKIAYAYAAALSWQAYALLAVGDYAAAIEILDRQVKIYETFNERLAGHDYESLEMRITAERRRAEAHLGLGDHASARSATERAAEIGTLLLARDPENINSLANVAITERRRSYLSGLEGNATGEMDSARLAVSLARRVYEQDRSHLASRLNLGSALVRLISADPKGASAEADELATLLDTTNVPEAGEVVDFYVSASLALATHSRASGDQAQATSRIKNAIGILRDRESRLTAGSLENFAKLLFEEGDTQGANQIIMTLYARGVRSPETLALRQRLSALPIR